MRYDLFPDGEQAVRDKRVLDFFGNVQGVEIEAGLKEAQNDWKKDLEALQKIIDKAQDDIKGSQDSVPGAPDEQATTILKSTRKQSRVALNMAIGGESWVKKIVGAASLLVLGGAWVASSTLSKHTVIK